MKTYSAGGLFLCLILMLGAFAVSAQEKSDNAPFDPQKFTVAEFLADITAEDGGADAGIALMWMHGYATCGLGYENVGPLTPKVFETLVAFLMYYGKEHPEASLLEAADGYVNMGT